MSDGVVLLLTAALTVGDPALATQCAAIVDYTAAIYASAVAVLPTGEMAIYLSDEDAADLAALGDAYDWLGCR